MFHTRAVHTCVGAVDSSPRRVAYADWMNGASGVGAVLVRATRPASEPGWTRSSSKAPTAPGPN